MKAEFLDVEFQAHRCQRVSSAGADISDQTNKDKSDNDDDDEDFEEEGEDENVPQKPKYPKQNPTVALICSQVDTINKKVMDKEGDIYPLMREVASMKQEHM